MNWRMQAFNTETKPSLLLLNQLSVKPDLHDSMPV